MGFLATGPGRGDQPLGLHDRLGGIRVRRRYLAVGGLEGVLLVFEVALIGVGVGRDAHPMIDGADELGPVYREGEGLPHVLIGDRTLCPYDAQNLHHNGLGLWTDVQLAVGRLL